MAGFDLSKPLLVLAPHLVLPARNGADLLVERTSQHLSAFAPSVEVLGANSLIRYEEGEVAFAVRTGLQMRSRQQAAVRTVLRRSHYLREKLLTNSYRREARLTLDRTGYGGVLCSYLTTTEVTIGRDLPVASWTQNDEFKWFSDLKTQTRHSFGWLVAESSLGYLRRNARTLAEAAMLIHVSEEDERGYTDRIGCHRSAVVPIGTDINVRTAPPITAGAVHPRLLFVGSLSAKMNAEALSNFQRVFAPKLRGAFPDLQIDICGSSPTRQVRDICRANQWRLHADVSDDTIDALYDAATFAVLPFAKSTGAKLKLLAAMAHGVPFLATNAVNTDPAMLVGPSVKSDNPIDWVDALARAMDSGISQAQRAAVRRQSEFWSWGESAARLARSITSGA